VQADAKNTYDVLFHTLDPALGGNESELRHEVGCWSLAGSIPDQPRFTPRSSRCFPAPSLDSLMVLARLGDEIVSARTATCGGAVDQARQVAPTPLKSTQRHWSST
jgi:hypothetical protein